MVTLQDLQNKARQLREVQAQRDRAIRNKLESERDFRKIQREREQLKAEIRALENPRSTRFKKVLASGLRKGGKGFLRGSVRFLDASERVGKGLLRASVKVVDAVEGQGRVKVEREARQRKAARKKKKVVKKRKKVVKKKKKPVKRKKVVRRKKRK